MDKNPLGSILSRKDSVRFIGKSTFIIIVAVSIFLSGFLLVDKVFAAEVCDTGECVNVTPNIIVTTDTSISVGDVSVSWHNGIPPISFGSNVLYLFDSNGDRISSAVSNPYDDGQATFSQLGFPASLAPGTYTVFALNLGGITTSEVVAPNCGTLTSCTDFLNGPIGLQHYFVTTALEIGVYSTIQDAVDDANPGDTISVAAGNYTEQININKSLTLSGAGMASTHIESPTPASMTIYDQFGSKSATNRYIEHRATDIPVVRIVASNVTVEGFHVDLKNYAFWDVKGSYGVNFSRGVGILVDHVETVLGAPDVFTGIAIQNNKVDGLLSGDRGDNIKVLGSATATVTSNTLYGGESGINAQAVDSPVRGQYYPTVTANNNTIYSEGPSNGPFGIGFWSGATGSADGNTIYNDPVNDGYALNVWGFRPVSFTNNYVTNLAGIGGLGVQLIESTNLIFTNNRIENQALAGAIWSNPTATITGNTITNCTDGFVVDEQTTGAVAMHNNSFEGIASGRYAVKVGGPAGVESGTDWGEWTGPSTVTVDATNNWWGTAVAATIAGKVSGSVDYNPYYVNEGMTILSSPAPVEVSVDATYTDGDSGTFYFGYNAFATIQQGINAVAESGTVNVAAGTYTENVNVDKSLTLQGASSATVTVTATSPTISVFTVTASNVTISGFTAIGTQITGSEGYAGIKFVSGVTNCNIHDNIVSGNQYGILLLETLSNTTLGNNTFTNNTASNCGVSGIEMQNTWGNTFTNNTANSTGLGPSSAGQGFRLANSKYNTFTGNTANSTLGTTGGNGACGFFLVVAGGTGSNNNTFTNNTANSNANHGFRADGSTGNTLTGNTFNSNGADGIKLKTGDNNTTMNNNTCSLNAIGIEIASANIDATSLTLSNNNISGNTTYGISNAGTGVLSATNNWWGTVSSTAILAKLSSNVLYQPYCGTSACTTIYTTIPVIDSPLAGVDLGVPPTATIDSTPSVTFLATTTITVGTSTVILPEGVVVTKSGGGNIDATLLNVSSTDPGSLEGLGTGVVVAGALQWGIQNLGLEFSTPITLKIYVGESLNGQLLNIVRSASGGGDWTNDGVSPKSCIVASGICEFTATKASYYVTGEFSVTTVSAVNIGSNTATLIGNITIVSGGEPATERGFEYGPNTSYGSSISEVGSFGAGGIGREIANLSCDITYHYRSYAKNSVGTVYGSDSTFRTNCGGGGGGGAPLPLPSLYAGAPTTPIPPTGSVLGLTTFHFTKTLQVGETSNDVTELQRRLTAEGIYSGPITGYFGPRTLAGVKAYQQKYGISQVGVVGPLTRAQLNSVQAAAAPQVAGASTVNFEAVQAQITALQAQLANLLQQLQQLLQSQGR